MADRNLRIRLLLEAGDKVTRPLRDIAGGSTRTAQALKATRDRLKEIDRAQADIASFRELKGGLKSTEAAMQSARTRATQLGRELAGTAEPTRKMTREFDRARKEADRLTRQHETQNGKLTTLRDRLRTAGVETSNLARHDRELRTAAAGANAELSEQGRRMQQLNDRTRRLAKARTGFSRTMNNAAGMAASGASAIGTGVAAGAPILRSIKAAQDYQGSMTDIAQKANLSRVEAAKMGAGLLVAARAANQLPDALQAGVDTLSGFGLDPRQAVAMMRPIGRAATAYRAEIADLSAAVFASHDNLKVPVEATGRMIDAMAQAGKSGAFELRDMAQYFPSLTAAYQGLGQTGIAAGADLAAAAQITRKGAGDASTAATNLSNVVQKINSPATIRAFKKFGVDLPASLQRAYKEGKTPIEAIAELTNKTLGGDLSKLGFLFEDAQVQAGLRPLIQNIGEYRRIRAEAIQAAQANTTTDGDFAERMKDSGEQSKQFSVRAAVLAITLGNKLLPAWNRVSAAGAAMADWIGSIAERYPNLTTVVVVGAAAMAALFVVLGGGALVIAGLIAPFSALVWVAGAFNMAMLPVIGTAFAVVAGFGLIIGAAYLLIKNWSGISAWFGAQWSAITGTVGVAVAFFSGLPSRFAQIGRDMISGMIRGIVGMLGNLKSTIVGAASSAANWFRTKLGIRSPSRVFAGFGTNIVQGLSNGIAAQESEPVRRMDRLSRRLSDAIVVGSAAASFAVPAAASSAARPPSPAAAPATGPAIVTINVYGAPGQDVGKLADEVKRKFDAEARSSAGASYADPPDWE